MKRARRSRWFYVTVGCGLLLLFGVVAGGGLFLVGFRMFRDIREQMADPAARTAKAKELLGTDRLPEGYYARVTFSVPLLGELVVLEGLERTFIYARMRKTERRLRDVYANGGEFDQLLAVRALELEDDELLDQGSLTIGGQTLTYRAMRGKLKTKKVGGPQGEVWVTLMEVDCEEFRKKNRLAIWVAPHPGGDAGFEDSPADPQAIRSFMSSFDVCAR